MKALMDPLPAKLTPVPKHKWPLSGDFRRPMEVWASKKFLVQVFDEGVYADRITVFRTKRKANDKWKDGITWDELQQIKRDIGRGDQWAVEVYPDDRHLIRDANMRHLFLVPQRPPFAWRRSGIKEFVESQPQAETEEA